MRNVNCGNIRNPQSEIRNVGKEEAMSNPGAVIIAILALAGLYVLVPRIAYILSRYRKAWRLPCPETGARADVGIDASRAALTSAFGRPTLRAKGCSLWPERLNCPESCLRLPGVETP
jgi:hypothetical protein